MDATDGGVLVDAGSDVAGCSTGFANNSVGGGSPLTGSLIVGVFFANSSLRIRLPHFGQLTSLLAVASTSSMATRQ